MKEGLKVGIKLTATKTVSENETAANIGSGTLQVFGTPYLIAFMEKTSLDILAPYLDEGESSVGTLVNIKHLKANKVGDEVSCESIITNIDGKRISFNVKAMHGEAIIGEGSHERFIISVEKFLAKL